MKLTFFQWLSVANASVSYFRITCENGIVYEAKKIKGDWNLEFNIAGFAIRPSVN